MLLLGAPLGVPAVSPRYWHHVLQPAHTTELAAADGSPTPRHHLPPTYRIAEDGESNSMDLPQANITAVPAWTKADAAWCVSSEHCDENGGGMQSVEVASTLSHLKAVATAWADGVQTALIVEGDASFAHVDAWPLSLQQLASRAPADWDALVLDADDTERPLSRGVERALRRRRARRRLARAPSPCVPDQPRGDGAVTQQLVVRLAVAAAGARRERRADVDEPLVARLRRRLRRGGARRLDGEDGGRRRASPCDGRKRTPRGPRRTPRIRPRRTPRGAPARRRRALGAEGLPRRGASIPASRRWRWPTGSTRSSRRATPPTRRGTAASRRPRR